MRRVTIVRGLRSARRRPAIYLAGLFFGFIGLATAIGTPYVSAGEKPVKGKAATAKSAVSDQAAAKACDKEEACCCDEVDPKAVARGRAIFLREWLPSDPRSHGGDGLGPVYNDSSCIACHNQGAPGGGGPLSKNIDILSASLINTPGMIPPPQQPQIPPPSQHQPPQHAQTRQDVQQAQAAQQPPVDVAPLIAFHSGFKNGRTVVLHKFGTDPGYAQWRDQISAMSGGAAGMSNQIQFTGFQPSNVNVMSEIPQSAPIAAPPSQTVVVAAQADGRPDAPPAGMSNIEITDFNPIPNDQMVAGPALQDGIEVKGNLVFPVPSNFNPSSNSGSTNVGNFVVRRSQRNPSSLFGIGLIDSISDKAIEAAAAQTFKDFPEVKGRVSRLKDGKIGKLGWKGQTANVEEFVLNACANEVGLEVPGHKQALVPQAEAYKPGGLDLTRGECDDLIAFVKSLPAPARTEPASEFEANLHKEGKALFASVGCATCHTPNLGGVEGLYSDLLLHDMGAELADAGSYGDPGTDPSDGDDSPFGPGMTLTANGGAGAAEVNANSSAPARPAAPKGANRNEWRTAPLWGFRDSGPYLHDGRAQTIEQAVAAHGGQASQSTQKYMQLSFKERRKIEFFLKSLTAPVDNPGRVDRIAKAD